jgi:hypothetical protein
MRERALKRSELYELVWKQPVRAVAADIGISDVALAKACRRQGIPLPGRGHWRRKELGYKVRQPGLPALSNGADPVISFRASQHRVGAIEEPSPEEVLEREPQNRIALAQPDRRLNKFVRLTVAHLRKQSRTAGPLVETRGVDRFRVSVALPSLDRVARLLQTLVEAWSARGHVITEGEAGKSLLSIKVNDEPIEVSITERTKRVVHPPSPKEEIRMELNPGWEPPLYDTVPTGVLAIRVINSPGQPQHATVRDRAGASLEDRLNEVLARMAEAARLIREDREARERQRRKWEEEEKRRAEARQRAELEQARLRRVHELVEVWQMQNALRGFLDVVRKRMEVVRPEFIPVAQAWIDWVEEYLDSNQPADPLFLEPLIQPGTSDFWHYSTPGHRTF